MQVRDVWLLWRIFEELASSILITNRSWELKLFARRVTQRIESLTNARRKYNSREIHVEGRPRNRYRVPCDLLDATCRLMMNDT